MFKNSIACLLLAGLTVACSQGSEFNLQGAQNTFQQSITQTNVKVDVLWVIDDSGSMETSQDNLAANFQSFIQKFQQTKFDYQLAVTTTGAWRASSSFSNDSSLSRFKDGNATTSTGVRIINPQTPNLEQTFIENIKQGINGDADERGWQSLKEALSNQDNLNEPFPRPGALLAVIFLTDEDDFSHDGSSNVQNITDPYNNPDLHDPMDYYNFLFNLTKSTENDRKFMVNTVGILDDNCRSQVESSWGGRKIARRYLSVTEASGGYKGSICDDFSDVMSGISDAIIKYTTRFVLDRAPVESSIVVTVNGSTVPNNGENGWTYDASTKAITFHGNAVPGQDAIVAVNYDPAELK